MKVKNLKVLIFSIVGCQLAGLIGSLATTPAIPTWYASLNKPAFNPPNYLFAPVWTTLYTLMGIALYFIILKRKGNKKAKYAVNAFIVHLFLNSFWSIVFFGFKNLGLAFFVIVILWLMIVYLIKLFWKIDKRASYLLIPYLLWVSFASALNFAIWQLN